MTVSAVYRPIFHTGFPTKNNRKILQTTKINENGMEVRYHFYFIDIFFYSIHTHTMCLHR